MRIGVVCARLMENPLIIFPPLFLGETAMGYYSDSLWCALGDAKEITRFDSLLAWAFGSPELCSDLESYPSLSYVEYMAGT